MNKGVLKRLAVGVLALGMMLLLGASSDGDGKGGCGSGEDSAGGMCTAEHLIGPDSGGNYYKCGNCKYSEHTGPHECAVCNKEFW